MTRMLAGRLEPWLGRHTAALLVAFTVVFFATAMSYANAKPFWHDEIYTLVISHLPSLGAVWTASREGLDLSPPLNTVATRLVESVAGTGRIASRLPPMLAIWAACLLLFVTVRRRAPPTFAVSAALLPCLTSAFRYAVEARGYGFTVGFFALAVYAWSEAAAGRRRRVHVPLLAVALAAGVWSHYFAVLAFVPIGGGELVRWWRARHVDWPIGATMTAAALLLLPAAWLLHRNMAQAPTYWTRTTPPQVAEAYTFLFTPLAGPRFYVAAAVLALLAVWALVARSRTDHPLPALPLHEVAAGVLMLALPALGVLAGTLASGVFTPRFVLFAVVGFSLVVPIGLSRLTAPRSVAGLVLAGVLAFSFLQSGYDWLRPGHLTFHDPVRDRPLLVKNLPGPRPVVVTSGLWYLQLWYYAPPELRKNLFYLVDPAAADRYTGSDTIDRGYLILRRWAPVAAEDYDAFVASHRTFEVYAMGSGWLLPRLRDEGASIQNDGHDGGGTCYLVRMPASKELDGVTGTPPKADPPPDERGSRTPDLRAAKPRAGGVGQIGRSAGGLASPWGGGSALGGVSVTPEGA